MPAACSPAQPLVYVEVNISGCYLNHTLSNSFFFSQASETSEWLILTRALPSNYLLTKTFFCSFLSELVCVALGYMSSDPLLLTALET